MDADTSLGLRRTLIALAIFLTPVSAPAQAATARTLVSATPIAGAPAGASAFRIVY